MNEICLPLGLRREDVPKLEEIVHATPTMHTGDKVLRQGDSFNKIYALKSGMCKSYRFDESGTEYIQSFNLPCGLIYAVLMTTLFANNAYQGAFTMLGFGLGTLPAMFVYWRALPTPQGNGV